MAVGIRIEAGIAGDGMIRDLDGVRVRIIIISDTGFDQGVWSNPGPGWRAAHGTVTPTPDFK